VSSVVSGYAGGKHTDAQYETVSTGATGHAEAVRITYDPAIVRYDQLLQVFFGVASDPTQLNQQYPDTGPQYRNAIVPQNAEQTRVTAGYLRAVEVAEALETADRHGGGTEPRVFPGRRLSSGFRAQESRSRLYPLLGRAQGCGAQEDVSAILEFCSSPRDNRNGSHHLRLGAGRPISQLWQPHTPITILPATC